MAQGAEAQPSLFFTPPDFLYRPSPPKFRRDTSRKASHPHARAIRFARQSQRSTHAAKK